MFFAVLRRRKPGFTFEHPGKSGKIGVRKRGGNVADASCSVGQKTLNGTYACENFDLLTSVPRGEWGFDGMVMTDWGAGNRAGVDTMMHAGNDLVMPGRTQDRMIAALQGNPVGTTADPNLDKALVRGDIQKCVSRVLTMIMRSSQFGKMNSKVDVKAHTETYDNLVTYSSVKKEEVKTTAVKKLEDELKKAQEKADKLEKELGEGNKKPEILPKLAQYELTLLDWVEEHRGYRKYVAIAGKCWPAFQTQFGFVPCYVNSRLTGRGIPVSCEVDIYGCLSEFIGTCVSQDAVTLLDINNTVPYDLYDSEIKDKFDYKSHDVFMGFHCGNTTTKKLSFCQMKYQLIMARSLPEEVTQGTLEGNIVPGDITFFRLQSTADNKLRAYVANGEVLPVATHSFGSIGVFAIPEMKRFYRHVLIEGNFPHHGAVAFGHYGKALYEVFKYVGVDVREIGYNQPAGVRYPTENPFA